MSHLVIVLSTGDASVISRVTPLADAVLAHDTERPAFTIASVFVNQLNTRDDSLRKSLKNALGEFGIKRVKIFKIVDFRADAHKLIPMMTIDEEHVVFVREHDAPIHMRMSSITLNHMFGLWDPSDAMPPSMVAHKRIAADRCVDFASRMYDPDAISLLMGEDLWHEVSLLERTVLIADLARYYLMWRRGGLYLDLDVLVKQDMRPLIDELVASDVHALLFTEHDACPTAMLGPRENPAHTKRIYNCMFWSRPNHPIWKRCFDLALERCRALSAEGDSTWSDTDVIWATGPDVVTTVWNESFSDDPHVRVMSNENTVRYLVHTHAGTWRNGRDII